MEVTEAKLEDLVRQAPDLIETGLRFVDRQRRTSDGRLDVLLVDSGGAIVVAELKVVEDDGMLIQALDYYDYVTSNREALARVYTAAKVEPTQPARLLLVAPSFSVTLLNRVKWFDLPISLFAYRCIQLQDDSHDEVPVYVEIKAPPKIEPVQVNSLEDVLGYITNHEVRSKATDVLNFLRNLGPPISIDPVKGAISIKKDGRVFAYLWPKRGRFTFGYYGSDNQWVTPTMDAQSDLAEVQASLRVGFLRGPGGA